MLCKNGVLFQREREGNTEMVIKCYKVTWVIHEKKNLCNLCAQNLEGYEVIGVWYGMWVTSKTATSLFNNFSFIWEFALANLARFHHFGGKYLWVTSIQQHHPTHGKNDFSRISTSLSTSRDSLTVSHFKASSASCNFSIQL